MWLSMEFNLYKQNHIVKYKTTFVVIGVPYRLTSSSEIKISITFIFKNVIYRIMCANVSIIQDTSERKQNHHGMHQFQASEWTGSVYIWTQKEEMGKRKTDYFKDRLTEFWGLKCLKFIGQTGRLVTHEWAEAAVFFHGSPLRIFSSGLLDD